MIDNCCVLQATCAELESRITELIAERDNVKVAPLFCLLECYPLFMVMTQA